MVLGFALGEPLARVEQGDRALLRLGLALVEHHDDASGRRVVEEVVGQQDDALDEIAVDEPLADVAFLVFVLRARAARYGTGVEDDRRTAGVLEHRERLLEPGPVTLA